MFRETAGMLFFGFAVAFCAMAAEGPAPGAGRIAGVIRPPGNALKVGVVERIPPELMKLNDQDRPGRYDPKTGEYAIENLVPNQSDGSPQKYDLFIETPEGRIEGVYLHVLNEEKLPTYDLNLATGQLATQRFDASRYFEEGQVITPEERDKVIRKKMRLDRLEKKIKDTLSLPSFNDTARVLAIHGTPERATVLLELMRKTAFYAEQGDQVIWRIETWPYEWMYDVWHKPNKGLRVWQRKRISADAFAKMGYVWAPALGGIEAKAGETTRLDYQIPEKFSDIPGHVREQSAGNTQ